MVITPVEATLDTALPEMVPNRPDATTAILAAPPRVRPIMAIEMSVMNWPPPVFTSRLPRNTNATTTEMAIFMGAPNKALACQPK